MNTSPRRQIATALLLLGALIAFVPAAQAERTRTRKGTTATDDNGDSATVEETTTRDKGDVTKNRSWTRADGKTGTSKTERKWDKASDTGTLSRETTLANGKTATTNGTLTKNADGSVSTDAARTGFNGKTETIDATTTKTDTGHTTTGTITGENGKVGTINSTSTKTADGHTRDATVTGPNGKTTERVIAVKKNSDGSYTRTVETTNADGTKSTRTENYTSETTSAK